ncbi:unnamed protein product, partial [Meganyctiphanes norvegica]
MSWIRLLITLGTIFLLAPSVSATRQDLHGCSTIYGHWWTPEYCLRYMLHWAATSGNATLATNLIQTGWNVNLPHNLHRTPLHVAAHWGRSEVVSVLLQNGADYSIVDRW